MALKQKKDALIEEITLIPDAYERLGYIVDRGKKASGLTEDLRIDSFKIEGCMSQLWMYPLTKRDFVVSSPSLTLQSLKVSLAYSAIFTVTRSPTIYKKPTPTFSAKSVLRSTSHLIVEMV